MHIPLALSLSGLQVDSGHNDIIYLMECLSIRSCFLSPVTIGTVCRIGVGSGRESKVTSACCPIRLYALGDCTEGTWIDKGSCQETVKLVN